MSNINIYRLRNLIYLVIISNFLSFNHLYGQDNYMVDYDKIDPTHFYNSTLLQLLDKSTATTKVVELSIDNEIKFGNIMIKLHKCWQAPLSQIPESKALIEVNEKNNNSYSKEVKNIFLGWMFASSPSISSLQHPIYDITILKCINK
ncbi:DUF2155 domain-containing protein [Rickettsiales bacterium]|nr:DUF2155 domain-containing protein [Rickettsiales bacterium]